MKSPIFILGSHKSGTSLLRSLLDGSPELFVIPLETHFFQLSGYWIDYALRRNFPQKLSFENIVTQFVNHIKISDEKGRKTGDSDLKGKWDVNKFADYMINHGESSYQSNDITQFYGCYISALHVSLYGYPPSADQFVDKSIENAEYATLLWKMFPGAKFIHMLRNPYATLISLRKHMTRDHYPYLGTIISSLNNSYYYLYKNPLIVDEYRIIRYEDLLSDPRSIMTTISKFINIEYSDSQLHPTTMGTPWEGNSTSGLKFDGISQQPLRAWQKEIHPLEIKLVNHFFPHMLNDYKYEMIKKENKIYYPIHGETLKTYLANRILWLFANAIPSKPIMS